MRYVYQPLKALYCLTLLVIIGLPVAIIIGLLEACKFLLTFYKVSWIGVSPTSGLNENAGNNEEDVWERHIKRMKENRNRPD